MSSRIAGAARRATPVLAFALLVVGQARAESISIVAPPRWAGTLTAGPMGVEPPNVYHRLRVGAGETTTLDLPRELSHRFVITFEADDGRMWRVVLSGAERTQWPKQYVIADSDLFEPCSATLTIATPGWGRMHLVSLLVRESDDYSRAFTLRPTGDVMTLELDHLRPGALQAYCVSDTGLQAQDICQVVPDREAVRHLTLTRQAPDAPAAVPLFESGGNVSSQLYTTVSVAVYLLVVVVWIGVGTSFVPVWHFFGIRQRAGRISLSVATAIIGIVLLSNGIAMFLLGQVRYVPLVSATASVQMALLVLCLLAYVSRKDWCRSLAVVGLVFAMVASLAFLPAFAFEGDDEDIGWWLTRFEVILVCAASLCLIGGALLDRRYRTGDGDRCPRCHVRPDPVTGQCNCPPKRAGQRGPRIARLTILHADGSRSDLLLGPRTVLGSGRRSHVILRGEPAAKPEHAVIERGEGGVVIRNLDPAAATQVNGVDIAEQPLADGDEIWIGETLMLVELI